MIRLLLDQGLPRSAASLLGRLGWDAVHVGDIGLSRATDAEVLERARLDDRVCVTLDADFHACLAVSGASRPSTIRVRIEGLDGRALSELLARVMPTLAQALDRGAMVTIAEGSVRVRRLPVTRG